VGRHRRAILSIYLFAVLAVMLAPIDRQLPLHSIDWVDKAVHFTLFVGVAVLGYWNFPRPLLVLLFAGAFATGIELLQATVPYRTMDMWDAVAGVLGGAAGVGVFLSRGGGTRQDDPSA
jgi:VanZ family protein